MMIEIGKTMQLPVSATMLVLLFKEAVLKTFFDQPPQSWYKITQCMDYSLASVIHIVYCTFSTILQAILGGLVKISRVQCNSPTIISNCCSQVEKFLHPQPACINATWFVDNALVAVIHATSCLVSTILHSHVPYYEDLYSLKIYFSMFLSLECYRQSL